MNTAVEAVVEFLCADGVPLSVAEEYADACETESDLRWPMAGGALMEMVQRGALPEYAAVAHRLTSRTLFGVQSEQWASRLHYAGVPIEYLRVGYDRRLGLQNILDAWTHDIPLEFIAELAEG